MSIQEQDLPGGGWSKPLQNLQKNTTSSDARLWQFRNKIPMAEANLNHPKLIKNTTPSDARLWAFRNKISIVEVVQNNNTNTQKHDTKWCKIMCIQK